MDHIFGMWLGWKHFRLQTHFSSSAGCTWTGVSCVASRLSFWLCRRVLMRSSPNTFSKPLMKRSWRYSRTSTLPKSNPRKYILHILHIDLNLYLVWFWTPSCFKLIVCGLGKIDISDWKSNTRLKHCTPESNIVKWFWKAVESFDEERRARLLQFVTGSSRVPLQGFKALQGNLPDCLCGLSSKTGRFLFQGFTQFS